jgi:AraC family transcriptional regulator of adaptative response / DNA-3-methyladenine glycosylase II
MELNADICYQAISTRDARFDGVFFVGVSTTRIYCRPVCPARTPGRDRCTFYPSAAAAEQAGFRPCLRCRPELAPGNARIDAVGRLAVAVMGRIEDGALTDGTIDDLAREMGVTGRHLRRVVADEFGVSPIALAQTHRLLTAKRLLTDTNLTVTEVAFASGFSSQRRFNALFAERYRLNPTQLRRGRVQTRSSEILTCELAYREPFDWPALLAFLGARMARGVEAVEGCRYLRTVQIGGHDGWIAVEPTAGKRALRVDLAASLAPVIVPVLARVKRLFDLAADPEPIERQLGALAAASPGLRVPGAFNGFEVAVRAILGQQVSVKAATTLGGRLAEAFGAPIVTPSDGLTHLTPPAEVIALAKAEDLRALGIVGSRAHAIISLAQEVADGRLILEPGARVEDAVARLRALPGIGEWTAQYIAMRALRWPDAFPHTDLGIMRALGTNDGRQVLRIAEAWRPWRAYAAMHLWRTLEERK